MHSDVNQAIPSYPCKRIKPAVQAFESSTLAWHLDQAIHYLNTQGDRACAEYDFLLGVLSRSPEQLSATVQTVFRRARNADATLRWNLLYILGDAGGPEVAAFLIDVASLKWAPAQAEVIAPGGSDLDVLVATEAVHALRRIATRHPRVLACLWQLVERKPPRPILLEIAQIAAELGLRRQLKKVLAQEDQGLLYMRGVKRCCQAGERHN